MPEHRRIVVGISPGARYLGLVALQEDEVRFRTIVARRYVDSLLDLRHRLTDALTELEPDLVVLEVPGLRRQTRANMVVERLAVQVLVELGVPTVRERLTVARRHLLVGVPCTRVNVHKALAERFPRLGRSTVAKDGMRWWSDVDRYWERAFGALTLAVWAESQVGLDGEMLSSNTGRATLNEESPMSDG